MSPSNTSPTESTIPTTSSVSPTATGKKREPENGRDPRLVDGAHAADSTDDNPRQVDFALLTINESEGEAVRQAFEGCWNQGGTKVGNRGSYAWGETKGFLFVHASTRDWKGPIATLEMIRELSSFFNPQYLLVLGTSGGIKMTPQIQYGQVVFSKQVHTGYVQLADGLGEADVIARLYDDPVLPPDKGLYFQAVEVSLNWGVDDRLQEAARCAIVSLEAIGEGLSVHPTLRETDADPLTGRAKPESSPCDDPLPMTAWLNKIIASVTTCFNIPTDDGHCAMPETDRMKGPAIRPEATEFYSGSFLIDGKKSRIFQAIQTTFPKVSAVEMEAGAVAQALQHAGGPAGPAGYLVIKGISDIIESDVPEAKRRDVRKALAPLASLGSAIFARQLIERWKGDTEGRVGRLRILPPKYAVTAFSMLANKPFSNSLVFYKVRLIHYSQLLKALCEGERVTEAWIFAYLAPFRFFEDYQANGRARKNGGKANEVKRMVEYLFSKYPHFQVFMEMSKNKPVTRIMHRGRGWELKNQKYLEAFEAVNGQNIETFVIREETLKQEDRWPISDLIVLNGDLALNYWFEDSKEGNGTLTMTYLDPGKGRAGFETFRSHCETLCKDETRYAAVIREILRKPKSRSKKALAKRSTGTPRRPGPDKK